VSRTTLVCTVEIAGNGEIYVSMLTDTSPLILTAVAAAMLRYVSERGITTDDIQGFFDSAYPVWTKEMSAPLIIRGGQG
jgi:hypothetical protein